MKNKKLKSRILAKFAIPALVLGLFFNFNFAKGEDFSWTQRTMPEGSIWNSVAYGDGTFVAVSGSGTNRAATSTDGINWTQRALPSSVYWMSVTYGNDVFVAVGSGSRLSATSSDGINWTTHTDALPANASWSSVAYGGGTFVAVATGTVAATSTDGINWTQRTLPAYASWRSVATDGNGTFVAVSDSYGQAARSTNYGLTWMLFDMPVFGNWNSITYGNGIFLAVDHISNSSNIAATSSDGALWAKRTLPYSGCWMSVAYGNGMFVATAMNSNISAISLDGIDWMQESLPASAAWSALGYGNGSFVALVQNSSIAANSTGGIMPSANTSTNINLGLDATISLTCSDSINMGTITGTGQSSLTTNEALCTVSTNNSTGYALSWQASTAYLENGTGDQITAYTPITPDTPENWSVGATESEWGAKLKSGSTTYDSDTWGSADTYSEGNWLNISTSPYQIITRTTETSQEGDSETLLFGAEIGSNKFQPTGTYDVDVTVTATTL